MRFHEIIQTFSNPRVEQLNNFVIPSNDCFSSSLGGAPNQDLSRSSLQIAIVRVGAFLSAGSPCDLRGSAVSSYDGNITATMKESDGSQDTRSPPDASLHVSPGDSDTDLYMARRPNKLHPIGLSGSSNSPSHHEKPALVEGTHPQRMQAAAEGWHHIPSEPGTCSPAESESPGPAIVPKAARIPRQTFSRPPINYDYLLTDAWVRLCELADKSSRWQARISVRRRADYPYRRTARWLLRELDLRLAPYRLQT